MIMKISTLSFLIRISFIFLVLVCTQISFADTNSSSDDQSQNKKADNSSSSSNTIVVHKPATDPSWGKVIQYQEEQSIVNRETLYKFLFQDSIGIVRTAIYHENTNGTGYWEVWVWDQP